MSVGEKVGCSFMRYLKGTFSGISGRGGLAFGAPSTPVLINTGHDNPPGLFGYLALLDVGLIAVALHRRWFYLAGRA